MLVTQNLSHSSGVLTRTYPLCPNCGRSMHFARVAPRPEGWTDVNIFRCGECGVSLAEAADDKSRRHQA